MPAASAGPGGPTEDADDADQVVATAGYRVTGPGSATVDPTGSPEDLLRVVAEAVDEAGVAVLTWRGAVGDWAARAAAWACGFTVEGTVRGLIPTEDGPVDGWVGSRRAQEPATPRHRWLEPPVLRGERVLLRPWREEDGLTLDLDQLVQGCLGPAPPTHATGGFPTWLLRHRSQMASGTSLGWCLTDPSDEEVLGGIGVFDLGRDYQHGSGRLDLWVAPQARGRGAVTESLHLVRAHAMAPAPADPRHRTGGLGLHRLGVATDVRHHTSQEVLVRAGWQWCGTELEACVEVPGGPRADTAWFEVLAEPADRAWTSPTLPAPPILRDGEVSLEPLAAADLPDIAAMVRAAEFETPDDDQSGDDPSGDDPSGVGSAEQWWARLRHRQWAGEAQAWLVHSGNGRRRTVGWVVAYGQYLPAPGRPRTASLGFWITPDHRGRGAASTAVGLTVQHLLDPPESGGRGMSEIRSETVLHDLAGQWVLLLSGFRPTGEPGLRRHYVVEADDDRVARAARARRARLDVPVLESGPLRLRPWREADLPRITQACRDARTQHFVPELPREYTPSEAAYYVGVLETGGLHGRTVGWCVADSEDDTCLGAVALANIDQHRTRTAEVGYWTHPDARGREVSGRATRAATGHALTPVERGGLGLERVLLRSAATNLASRHVAQQAGFTEVGRDRSAEVLGDGTRDDFIRFDLVRADLTDEGGEGHDAAGDRSS